MEKIDRKEAGGYGFDGLFVGAVYNRICGGRQKTWQYYTKIIINSHFELDKITVGGYNKTIM